ncbi:DUF2004 domain-containing protein [Aeoliella sp.]|uniref:DUF2004 domain-containing protein n=1 Tax=Aeoliella sp. TaxID=2795800 RepID=UPI003CCBA3D0
MTEIERRQAAALAAIRTAFGTAEDQYGATLFVSHHLTEIDDAYWQEHLQSSSPEPVRVLDLLVFQSHWSEDDDEGLDTFDFTLPGDVTNYVISVSFNEDGKVEEIVMES